MQMFLSLTEYIWKTIETYKVLFIKKPLFSMVILDIMALTWKVDYKLNIIIIIFPVKYLEQRFNFDFIHVVMKISQKK